jgi:hypothetical protein
MKSSITTTSTEAFSFWSKRRITAGDTDERDSLTGKEDPDERKAVICRWDENFPERLGFGPEVFDGGAVGRSTSANTAPKH